MHVARWARNSLTTRTLILSGAFAATLAVGFAVLVIAIGGLRSAGEGALRAQQAVTVATELERSVVALENGLRGFVATNEEKDLRPFTVARDQYPRQVRRLQALAGDDPRLRAIARRASTLISDYVGLWALPLLELAREEPKVARALLDDQKGRERVTDIRRQLRKLSGRADAEAAGTASAANTRADVAVAMGLAGIVLVVLVAFGVVALLRRKVLAPISEVAGASGAVAAGDLSVRVATERTDELGALARTFNAMATSLERNQAELATRAQDLERSNRELEDYASVTSHDLQGPLVTIGMYAGLLEKRLAGDPDARKLAAHIRAGAERMRALTRDLLAYARLEKEAGASEPVELDVLLGETLESLAGPLSDRDAQVVAEELPTVYGDAARLRQVLQNLLANAIKFSDADARPRVEITGTLLDDGTARIDVRDDGIGFAPGQAELIFRPFQRLHAADRYEGTGIGLAVCQKIVEQHGGRIWAEGEPGAGATFSFVLPAVGHPEPDRDHPGLVGATAR